MQISNNRATLASGKGNERDDAYNSNHRFADEATTDNAYYSADIPGESMKQPHGTAALLLDSNEKLPSIDSSCTELESIIQGGSLEALVTLLDDQKEGGAVTLLHEPNEEGYNTLHLAAMSGHIPIVRYLLCEYDMDITETTRNNVGCTSLHLAVKHLHLIQYLLEEGEKNKHRSFLEVTDRLEWTPLFYAVRDGNLDIARYLLEEAGANIEARNDEKYTVLHLATDWGHVNVVKYLVETHHLDCTSKSVDGWQPLHLAVKEDDFTLVKYLCDEQNVNPESKQDFGYAPLHIAAIENCLDICKYLLETRSVDPNTQDMNGFTPLHCAASSGSMKVLRYFVEDHDMNVLSRDLEGWAPLHVACRDGQLEAVQYLLEQQHHQDESNDTILCMEGRTPLHFACKFGKLHVVQYLIAGGGAAVEQSDRGGARALHLAAAGGHLEVCRHLVGSASAAIDATDSDGWTALHYAAHKGHLDMVQYFVETSCAKMTVAARISNYTPLHVAICAGRLKVVQYLVEHAQDAIHATFSGGQTSLHLAVSKGHVDIVKYLMEEKQADPEDKEDKGYTALHVAVVKDKFDVFEYLLRDQSVNIEALDNVNQTTLHLAAYLDRVEMTQVLLELGASPLAEDEDGDTPLHSASLVQVAKLLMDWCHARDGEDDDGYSNNNTINARQSKLLLARNRLGKTPHDVAVQRAWRSNDDAEESLQHHETLVYLSNFVAPLAVSTTLSADGPAVVLNHDLSDEQHRTATKVLGMLQETTVHEVSYHVLGYLCLFDVTAPPNQNHHYHQL